jgi:hypothetical protein
MARLTQAMTILVINCANAQHIPSMYLPNERRPDTPGPRLHLRFGFERTSVSLSKSSVHPRLYLTEKPRDAALSDLNALREFSGLLKTSNVLMRIRNAA